MVCGLVPQCYLYLKRTPSLTKLKSVLLSEEWIEWERLVEYSIKFLGDTAGLYLQEDDVRKEGSAAYLHLCGTVVETSLMKSILFPLLRRIHGPDIVGKRFLFQEHSSKAFLFTECGNNTLDVRYIGNSYFSFLHSEDY